jgi:hypothetical protein
MAIRVSRPLIFNGKGSPEAALVTFRLFNNGLQTPAAN